MHTYLSYIRLICSDSLLDLNLATLPRLSKPNLKWHWKWPSFPFEHFRNVHFDIATGYFDVRFIKGPNMGSALLKNH